MVGKYAFSQSMGRSRIGGMIQGLQFDMQRCSPMQLHTIRPREFLPFIETYISRRKLSGITFVTRCIKIYILVIIDSIS